MGDQECDGKKMRNIAMRRRGQIKYIHVGCGHTGQWPSLQMHTCQLSVIRTESPSF